MENQIKNNCIFCKISHGETETQLLYQDEEYVVFRDIRPAAKHHFLVVTKQHISDAKCLTRDQVSIVSRMKEIGIKVLADESADLNDSRFGFHWPPFHSVSHLHMHAISPASTMGFIARIIFRENSLWFVSPEYVEDRLRRMEE